MARYKPQERHRQLLPVVLSEQLIPGSFAFALAYLVDHELDLAAMAAEFKNDEVGVSAYDPRVMFKIVLLAYSQGIISGRSIENICLRNVQFIAMSGDSQPSHAHIVRLVSGLGEPIQPLFSQALMIEKTTPCLETHILITADSGYYSDNNVDKLKHQEIPR